MEGLLSTGPTPSSLYSLPYTICVRVQPLTKCVQHYQGSHFNNLKCSVKMHKIVVVWTGDKKGKILLCLPNFNFFSLCLNLLSSYQTSYFLSKCHIGSRGKKAHIQAFVCALVCAPKLVWGLVCAPKLVWALVCAPKLACAPKLVCAPICALVVGPLEN